MELRARIRPLLRRAGMAAALTALLVPAAPATADAKKKRAPVVKKITPKRVFVGETMTIRGRHFRRGIGKNTVAFKRRGAKAVLARAGKSTGKMMRIKLPQRLEKILRVENGTPIVTRLRVRVLSKKFGRRYTKGRRSPLVGPEKPPAPPVPPVSDGNADCDGDGTVNRLDADDDNDLLPDATEAALNKLLDPCKTDTDGDGASDGYEVQSARDLNDDEHQNANSYLPYPRKLPYPNPLDGEDQHVDHDGDALTLLEEFKLWQYTGAVTSLERLSYSAGEQYSKSERVGGGNRVPTLTAAAYGTQNPFLVWAASATVRLVDVSDQTWWDGATSFPIRDFDRSGTADADEIEYYDHFDNGYLDDSERDEDADGLTNWAETRGCMLPEYWSELYEEETPYYVTFAGTSHVDADSDGDTIRDGADDQDHDDVPNVMECRRTLAGNATQDALDATTPAPDGRLASGWVQPFNPCLPNPYSRSCKRILTGDWAPFDTDAADIYFAHE